MVHTAVCKEARVRRYNGVCSGLGCLELGGGKRYMTWTLARPLLQ